MNSLIQTSQWKIVGKHLNDNSLSHGKYSKQGTKSMRKIWGKTFGLDRKSLGSDTETWS